MKNKRLIAILGILFFIVFIVVLSSTVFTLVHAEVVFSQVLDSENTNFGTDNERQAVIQSANFDFGKCIFFIDKQAHIDYLEKANPYLEVLNIETIFPNKFIIHALEREELYSIRLSETSFAIMDKSLKVLDINAVSRGVSVLMPDITEVISAELGQTLNIGSEHINMLCSVYSALSKIGATETEIGYSVADIIGTFSKIQLDTALNTITLETFVGTDIIIKNPNNDLLTKMLQAMSAFENSPEVYDTITVEDIIDVNNPSYYIFYAD